MRKYNGAISLFMVVILLTSFIFGGVFIDASRIVVAKSKVRNAMNSALRSSMSYYDKSLVGDYGLYAYDGGEADAIFKKYFNANMHIKDENLKMFDYNIVKAGVSNGTLITDPAEFRRQVVEYSKYKAPVTTTMILIDKVTSTFANFKSNADNIKDATDSLDEFKEQYKKDANQIKTGLSSAKTNAANQLKGIVDDNVAKAKDDIAYIDELQGKINEHFGYVSTEIGNSKNTMDKMEQDTENYRNEASQDLAAINGGAAGISDGNSSDDGVAEGSYPTVTQDKDVAQQADDQTGPQGTLRTAVSNLESSVSTIKGEIDGLVASLKVTTGSLIQAKATLETYKADVAAKKSTLDDKSAVLSNTYEKWNAYSTAQSTYNTNNNKATECETKIDEAILSLHGNEAYLDAIEIYRDPTLSLDYDKNNPKTSIKNIKDNLKNQYSDLKDVFSLIEDYNTYVKNRDNAAVIMNQSNGASLKSAYDKALAEKNAAQTAYDTAVGKRDHQQGVVNTLDGEVDNLNEAIKGKLNDLKNLAVPQASELNIVDLAKDKITSELDKVDIIAGLKDLYKELSKEMQTYSLSGNDGDDVESKLSSGLIKKIKSLCEYAQDMFNTFTNPTNLRDNAYMVDYIMDKCTYLTSQTPRNHYFEKGEVEYIIFGNKSQIANITACIGTITLMRFVINFIDYFVKAPGDLIAKAIYGLGRGAAKTVLDMRSMLLVSPETNPKENIRDGIGLCPSFDSLKLTYSDHLRLLLFFKFSKAQEGLKDTIYTNMNNTLDGGDLNNLYTRMSAEVEVDVNLIVLPIFVGEFTGANFRNGNFVIKDKATLGY